MIKTDIGELENKISELQKELDLWKQYRELKDKLDSIKKEPIITTIPYMPYYPIHPTYPTYPNYPWIRPYYTTITSNEATIGHVAEPQGVYNA